MKKVVIFVVLLLVLIASCSAQSTNNERRIIGTWVNQENQITWTFNADGTFGSQGSRFGVTDTKLFILQTDGRKWLYNISISSDGRTLILEDSVTSSGILWFVRQ